MELYRFPRQDARKFEEVSQSWPSSWPDLNGLLRSLDRSITCLQVNQITDGHKALIRFKNGYGLEIIKYLESEFFEMTVVKFLGRGVDMYEFAITSLPDLSLGSEEDLVTMCDQVSWLK
jgi:hypothetical protein